MDEVEVEEDVEDVLFLVEATEADAEEVDTEEVATGLAVAVDDVDDAVVATGAEVV